MPSEPFLSDVSLILLSITVCMAAYLKYFSRPSPLVHPLLLGKQSDLSATREKNQSGIYRNWATGHGSPLSLRPASSLKTVANIADIKCPQRFIYEIKISNDLLKLRANNVSKGLISLLSTSRTDKASKGILNLLPDGFDSLLLSIAMSLQPDVSHPLLTLSNPALFNHVVGLPVPPAVIVVSAKILKDVLGELAGAGYSNRTIVYAASSGVEQETSQIQEVVEMAKEYALKVVSWQEVEALGSAMKDTDRANSAKGEGPFAIQFWEDDEEKPQTSTVTHQNVTSGIASVLSLFPAHKRPSPATNDMVVSCIPLAQPVGITLALASIWSGAGFRTVDEEEWQEDQAQTEEKNGSISKRETVQLMNMLHPEKPSPTIVFLSTPMLVEWSSEIENGSHPYLPANIFRDAAKQHQLANIADGYVGRSGYLEKFYWKPLRLASLKKWAEKANMSARRGIKPEIEDKIRAVIVVGPTPSPRQLLSAQIHLSLPITRITTSLTSTSPLFISHFHDLQQLPPMSVPTTPTFNPREIAFTPKSSQSFQKGTTKNVDSVEWEDAAEEDPVLVGAHTGPPASNIEVLVRELDEDVFEETGDIEGVVWIRGPTVLGGTQDEKGWTKTALRTRVLKNGAFSMFPSRQAW
ncbi:hypothetical protein [Phaffia rhodozyma]|uniref:Uncharacterized protein n=1 Tax=Phaffia rhodozyma TaxID=264483 RepID=A0A0F7SV67_PHARH|nr:hypothetical protein [Phaffia rhodozyma]